MSARLFGLAALCAVAFIALGIWVTHHSLSRIDVESAALRGANLPLAAFFTNSGYGVALTVLGVCSVAAAVALRAPLVLPLVILISQIISQAVVNGMKAIFARARPDAWFYRHELGFSYPSGHATTAIVFYGAWLVVAWLSPLPIAARIGAAALLGLWMFGICWSRVALGAHYPTDVIGGLLFGAAWLFALAGLVILRDPSLPLRRG